MWIFVQLSYINFNIILFMSVNLLNSPLQGSSIASPDQKEMLKKRIFDHYNIIFQTPGVPLEDIEVFCFGEKHSSESCKQLNGESITQIVGTAKAALFVEGSPSFSSFRFPDELKKEQYIPPSCLLDLFGWDASHEIIESMGNSLGVQEALIHSINDLRVHILNFELKKLDAEKRTINWKRRTLDAFHARDKITFDQYTQAIKDEKILMTAYEKSIEEMKMCKCDYEKELAKGLPTKESLRRTFPDRTRAMVATLQCLRSERKYEGKAIFIAGADHLDMSQTDGEEYNLQTLYDELAHHKAIVLVPKMISSS